MTTTLLLRAGRDDAARRRHPWVFSRAIAGAPPGGEVEVRSASRQLLGRGFASLIPLIKESNGDLAEHVGQPWVVHVVGFDDDRIARRVAAPQKLIDWVAFLVRVP